MHRLVRSYATVKAVAASAKPNSKLHEYFTQPQSYASTAPVGLFGNPNLDSASGLSRFAQTSLEKAQTMDKAIQTGQVPPHDVIRRLDILSDVICKVVDMAAFVRLSHPRQSMLQASQDAHELMFEFMNHLNTSPGLYHQVCRALQTADVRNSLSAEEIRVGEILKHDFEKSGIQFSDETASSFIHCSNVVSVLGQKFLNNIGPAQSTLTFNARELEGLNPYLLKQLQTFTGKVHLPLDGGMPELALQTVHNADARRRIWLANRLATDDQVATLTEVLTHRAAISKISGYDSFASYELSDKMMRTPAHVNAFLESLAATIAPKAKQELQAITPAGTPLRPWDHSYYLSQFTASQRGSAKKMSGTLTNYFTLGNVLQGISDLCESLYGIRFEPGTVAAGEVWDHEVRRLDVFKGDQRIGIIYCDLFNRQGKSPNPAHFTIQCSRQVYPWESELWQDPNLQVVTDNDGQVEKYQLPIIALVCDFFVQNNTCLLTFNEVQTLFHEMGHAIHSMVGRTKLHNVGGTRCATDFVELPSILMEKFAADPAVLSTFARHHETGEPLPMELFRRHQALSLTTENWETHHQILLSFIDQALHGPEATSPGFNPVQLVTQVESKHGLYSEHGPRQFAQFGHLVSYGATYYSYLLDRCLANMAWDKVFKADPLSPEAGAKFENAVLKWGGSRDALECTEDLLGPIDYSKVAEHIQA